MTKLLVAIMGAAVAVGCGDPGSSTGGADASVTCRAPAGCFALQSPLRDSPPRCQYACDDTSRRVCVPIADGGAVNPSELRPSSGIPLDEIAGDPYSANLQNDTANCGGCGRRCAAPLRYCVRGVCSPDPL